MGKTPDLFRINFVSGKPLEVLLAKFLKSSEGTGKENVMAALSAFYYSIALSQEADACPSRIQLAAIQDLAKLRNQIDYIINYHRITNGIELTDRFEVPATEKIGSTVGHPLKPIAIDPIIGDSIETLVADLPVIVGVGVASAFAEASPLENRLSGEDEIYDYTIFDE
ncbi:hypothetical protein C7B77_00250 [Chamaesiphon polymorphus CCALA 037]|uniref:Uncharacterized protein n=2 Tax=Chamaesiphon TaxID=217161 RepID=A0A2T1GNN0_9CYAN|nr:hypothetical protein C7B77_00250 [Chamaesiphon polymorphus CCALA 037]